MSQIELSNVFVVFKNDEPQKSKGGKLFHHAKQHAASSIRQLCKEEAFDLTPWHASFEDHYKRYEERKRLETELQKQYQIKEFKLVEIQ